VQFDDAAAQGRALLAAAEAHMDALEHSVFAGEGGGGDGVPHFCCLSSSAGDAMACACAAAAAGACPHATASFVQRDGVDVT
jgi:hypothetical protein